MTMRMSGQSTHRRLGCELGFHHKKTPVVFITSLNDFENRTNSTMAGGNDFIGKPFLFIELTVKALIHVLKAKLAPKPPVG